MKLSHLKSATSTFFLFYLMVTTVNAAESLSVSGRIDQIACTLECGNCCGSYLLQDGSGEIKLNVGKSNVDLGGVMNTGVLHRVTGSFYETSGSCGINQCSLFEINSVDEPLPAEPVYDERSGELSIPSAKMSDSGDKFAVILSPPFNIKSITAIGKNKFALQGESCTVASGAQCDTGLSCLSYYGIAGPSGPEFRTCEIPCSASGSQCPSGQACVTVADGPGQVCQAKP